MKFIEDKPQAVTPNTPNNPVVIHDIPIGGIVDDQKDNGTTTS